MLIERVQGTIVCVQDTVVYVPRARLYMCLGHNHRTHLANVTETHFNQAIVKRGGDRFDPKKRLRDRQRGAKRWVELRPTTTRPTHT